MGGGSSKTAVVEKHLGRRGKQAKAKARKKEDDAGPAGTAAAAPGGGGGGGGGGARRRRGRFDSPVYKIVLLGDRGCGRTALFQRFILNSFETAHGKDYRAYIGVKIVPTGISNPVTACIQLWDVPGRVEIERMYLDPRYAKRGFPEICDMYFDEPAAFIVCLDCQLSEEDAAESAVKWVTILREYFEGDVPCDIYLCGTKIDSETREVTDKKFADISSLNELRQSFTVSAKSSRGIDIMFRTITAHIMNVVQEKARAEGKVDADGKLLIDETWDDDDDGMGLNSDDDDFDGNSDMVFDDEDRDGPDEEMHVPEFDDMMLMPDVVPAPDTPSSNAHTERSAAKA